jgi:hypothetical protein
MLALNPKDMRITSPSPREVLLSDPQPQAVLNYAERPPYDVEVLEQAIAPLTTARSSSGRC